MTAIVYRAYDDDENLLYVGCAVDIDRRLKEHRSASAWVRFAAEISTRQYPTLDRARAVEKRAIRLLTPLYNCHGVREGVQRSKCLAASQARWRALSAGMGTLDNKEGQSDG